jgi:hypothetical protein
MSPPDGLVAVHLLRLPVPLAAKARQHFEGLMREFELIAAGSSGGESHHQVPARLTQLVEALTSQFAGVTTEADERLEDAMEQQLEEIDDHVLELPVEAAPASEALGALIDEADEYCRQGEHLLTLGSPPDCVAYRNWYLGQVVSQLGGGPAIAWPDSEQARSY